MTEKETLHWYLRVQRDALASKLDGVSEYDARRPQVPTGTNLLGIVKHGAYVQLGYLGDCLAGSLGRHYRYFKKCDRSIRGNVGTCMGAVR